MSCDMTGPNITEVVSYWLASACGHPGGHAISEVCKLPPNELHRMLTQVQVAERRALGLRNDIRLAWPKNRLRHCMRARPRLLQVPLPLAQPLPFREVINLVEVSKQSQSAGPGFVGGGDVQFVRPRKSPKAQRISVKVAVRRSSLQAEFERADRSRRCETPEPEDHLCEERST